MEEEEIVEEEKERNGGKGGRREGERGGDSGLKMRQDKTISGEKERLITFSTTSYRNGQADGMVIQYATCTCYACHAL